MREEFLDMAVVRVVVMQFELVVWGRRHEAVMGNNGWRWDDDTVGGCEVLSRGDNSRGDKMAAQ